MLKEMAFLEFLLISSVGILYTQTLTIRVENIEPGKGFLMVGVFNDKNNFPDNYFQGQRIRAVNGTMNIIFNNLPVGTYAISVYQDINENEQLDKNFLDIPKERYGFSNNSNRPIYERCLFDFNNEMTISIRIK